MRKFITATLLLTTAYSTLTAPSTDKSLSTRKVVQTRDADITIIFFKQTGCTGGKDYSGQPAYAQNTGSYSIKSFSTSRDLEEGEHLDFSAPPPSMLVAGATLTQDEACYIFQEGWLANLTKGCTDLQNPAACFRLWQD